MIIDSHVHIGKILNFNMRKQDVLYSMDAYGIDYSIVSDVRATEFDHQQRELPMFLQKPQLECIRGSVEFAKECPGKIGAALWLRPFHEEPDELLYDYIRENRPFIKALKFHPFHSKLPFDSNKMEPYMVLAEYFGLPVLVHTGGSDNASCMRVYYMAKRHPSINFVMVHMGLGTDNNEAIYLIGQLPNLYGDTTWVKIDSTLRFIERNGSEKLLFGSDNPIDGKDTYWYNKTGEPSIYRPYFDRLKDMVTAEAFDNIMYRNSQRLFKL